MLKKMLPVMLAVMLALSLTACGQRSGAKDNDASSSSQSANEAPMSEGEYMAKVEELRKTGAGFAEAINEFDAAVAASKDAGAEPVRNAVERLEDSRDVLLEFSRISNPPAGYESAHADLVKSSKELGELVGPYVDTVLEVFNGEEINTTALIKDIKSALEKLADGIRAVGVIYQGEHSIDANQAPMSEEEYMAKVEELNDFAGDFIEATTEFVTVANNDFEDVDGMTAAVEKIRASKEGFLKFSEISNPPAEYVDAHANLSKSAKEYGELVDKYADVLLKAINGEEDPALRTIVDDMDAAVNNLTNDINAIEAIYNR